LDLLNFNSFQVIPVNSGSCTLKDAVNEAFRDWVTNLSSTYYLVGSCIGPHPFPTIVRDYQKVIGEEIKQQLKEVRGKLPDAVVACVGGGSNAIGTFYDFIEDKSVRLIGVEAGGEGKVHTGFSIFLLIVLFRHRWRPSQCYTFDGSARCPSRGPNVHSTVYCRSDRRNTLDQRRAGLPWSGSGTRLAQRFRKS
jgi:hypothetical protein